MEVIVSLEDRTTFELTDELSRRFGKSLTRAREGIVNPDAPACNTQFGTNKFGEAGIRTLETFRFTRFPGVPFQPLTHLSVYS